MKKWWMNLAVHRGFEPALRLYMDICQYSTCSSFSVTSLAGREKRAGITNWYIYIYRGSGWTVFLDWHLSSSDIHCKYIGSICSMYCISVLVALFNNLNVFMYWITFYWYILNILLTYIGNKAYEMIDLMIQRFRLIRQWKISDVISGRSLSLSLAKKLIVRSEMYQSHAFHKDIVLL